MKRYPEELLKQRTLSEVMTAGADQIKRFSNYTESAMMNFPEGEVNTHFCAYIELHTDRPVHAEKKWKFRVVYQGPGCAYVYTDAEGKFCMIRRFDLKVVHEVYFSRPHAVVPTKIAERMVELNSNNFPEYFAFENKARFNYYKNPKLVFIFLNFTG